MRTAKGLRAVALAGSLLGAAMLPALAGAQGVSTERPGSILIFPKVVNDDTDTVIQITNTTNSMTYAHCFYVNADEVNGAPLWQVTDFSIALTRQQPTHWAASAGRAVNPFADPAGLDPGLVPPVPPGFTGFLTCVETLMDGTPTSANSLIGTATVGGLDGTAGANVMSKYNAVAIPGCLDATGPCGDQGDANNGDNVLSLDNVEYARCPGGLYLNFQSEGGQDLAIASAANNPSVVSTNLSLVPCGIDFDNLEPIGTAFRADPIRDEFETLSSSNTVEFDCYFSEALSAPIFGTGVFTLGTEFGSAILRAPLDSGLPPVVGVANVLRTAGDGTSDTAAFNLPFCTEETAPSSCVGVDTEIRLPNFD